MDPKTHALIVQEELNSLKLLHKEIEANCRIVLATKELPIETRWNIFKDAPNKLHCSSSKYPFEKDLGIKEISPYDDWSMERGETFDVVKMITDWEKQLNSEYKSSWIKTINQDIINKFKEYYMDKYIGSWNHDW